MIKHCCDFCGRELNTGTLGDQSYSLKLPVSNYNMLRGSSIIPHTVEICGVCARSLAIYISSEWGYGLE